MHRAVGGSWTEYLKTDKVLRHLADAHSTAAGLPSIRTCPFCRVNHGTPRHYVMECQETKDYAEEICDAVERELFSLQCTQTLIEAANAHVAILSTLSSHPAPELCVSKWPILSWHGGGWCESLPERSPFGRLRLALSYLNLSPPWTWPIGVYFLLRSVMPSTK